MSNQSAMYGFGLSAAITSLLTALLVVAKETNEALISWMKAVTGHHWITHGILTLAIFVTLGLILMQLNSKERWLSAVNLIVVMGAAVMLGGGIIFGFFLVHM